MGVIFDERSRVLLVRQSADGRWTTPGGLIEPDETPAAAAVREVREETGLTVRIVGLLGVYGGPEFVVQYPNGDRSQYISIVFDCAVVEGSPIPDGVETDAVAFVGPDELARLDCQPWLHRFMPLLWRRSEKPFFE